MTTQEFIQKIPEELRLHTLGHCKSLSELVLDTEVWRAVGKVEGWEEDKEVCRGSIACIKGVDEKHSPCLWETIEADWKVNIHRMVQALIDGKSLEEYLSTL